jgi:hypothetical protein
MIEKIFWLIGCIIALKWAWYLITTPGPWWKYMTMDERRWAKKWLIMPFIGQWDMDAPQCVGEDKRL